MSPFVSIHILNYNGGDDILRCLRSLSELKYPHYRIVVIDNASTDQSIDILSRHFPNVRILRNQQNLGFGAGHNIGFQDALEQGCDFVWILNQDAWVAPDSLSHLIQCAETSPKTGAISPLILNPDDTIWFADGDIDWLRMRVFHTFPKTLPQAPFETIHLTGCALLLRRTAIEKTKGFDERFFLYYEDADLSLRLRTLGFSLLVAPSSRVWHAETSERYQPKKVYFLVLSGLIFFRQHVRGFQVLTQTIILSLRKAKNWIDITLWPNPTNQAVRQAYRDFARMKF